MSVVFKQTAWPSLRASGPDAARWLDGLVTCAVGAVTPGRGAWGALLSKQGKIQAELQMVQNSDALVLGVSGGDAASVQRILDGYLVMEDAEITASDARFLLAIGHDAELAMRQRDLAPHALPWGGTPVCAAVVSARPLGEWARDVEWVSEQDWESIRIRNGWYRYGVDYSEKDNLHGASLERRVVDWKKGCYLGQEVVCMQDMRGKVKRRLAVTELLAGELPPPGAELQVQATVGSAMQQSVGEIRSAAGRWAIAKLETPFDEPGTELSAAGCRLRVMALQGPSLRDDA